MEAMGQVLGGISRNPSALPQRLKFAVSAMGGGMFDGRCNGSNGFTLDARILT